MTIVGVFRISFSLLSAQLVEGCSLALLWLNVMQVNISCYSWVWLQYFPNNSLLINENVNQQSSDVILFLLVLGNKK